MSTIRTRFAPSPTGFLHVGNIRTGLFAWLVARHSSGQFVLRLEDTDKKREIQGSAEHLLECLKVLGIEIDEGYSKNGTYGPYIQSERLAIYKKWAQKLIDSGRAYADPYTPEQIQEFREQATAEKRAFLYRHHRPENPPVWDGTMPLRFKSDPKSYSWHDEVMGNLSTGPEVIDDIILIKSDGFPTYNFAHIVDDAEMHITHIIRGQEFISSQSNYLNIYEALGIFERPLETAATTAEYLQPESDQTPGPLSDTARSHSDVVDDDQISKQIYYRPIFATMPHILAATGGKKLGKRDGAKDVLDYIRDGILPEALVNFIASLGWNDGTEQEIFSRDELIAKFSLDRVQKSGARFDEQRLLWMNGQWIRRLTLDDLYARTINFWPTSAETADEDRKKQILALVQDRLKTLQDLPTLTNYFFEEPIPDWQMITDNKQLKKLEKAALQDLLKSTYAALEKTDFTESALTAVLNNLLSETGQKPGILFSLIRISLTWTPFSPGLAETMAVLGKETTLKRLLEASGI